MIKAFAARRWLAAEGDKFRLIAKRGDMFSRGGADALAFGLVELAIEFAKMRARFWRSFW